MPKIKLPPKSRLVAIFLALVVLLVAVAEYTHFARTTNTKTPVTSPAGTSPSPSSSTKAINPTSGTQNAPATPIAQPSPNPGSSSLAAPTGQLYSTDPPVSLKANTPEESVCQTVISAACQIVLVSPVGSQVAFAAPSIDTNGGHLVDWKLQQYITRTGLWKIFARASLNGQTSNSPQYNFEVNP